MIDYILHLTCLVFITSGMLAGQQLLFFDGGLLCLGTAAFYAIGAYSSAVLSKYFECPVLLSIFFTTLLIIFIIISIGIPLLKYLKDDFFALATLGLSQTTYVTLRAIAPGRSSGMAGIPEIHTSLTKYISPTIDSLFICIIFTCICFTIIYKIRKLRVGILIKACRNDENALVALGHRPLILKLEVFSIAGCFAGIAGSIHAHYLGAVEPHMASISQTILFLCGTILSGKKYILGTFIGAAFLIVIPEVLQRIFIAKWGVMWQIFPIVQICYGILIVCVTIIIFSKFNTKVHK